MKRYHARGFLYNPYSKKVLLAQMEPQGLEKRPKWAILTGDSKRGEQPLETFQRSMKEALKLRLSKKAVQQVYDYYNSDLGSHAYVYCVNAKFLKAKPKLSKDKEFKWILIVDALKLELADRTRQDLTFFYREIQAKIKRPAKEL